MKIKTYSISKNTSLELHIEHDTPIIAIRAFEIRKTLFSTKRNLAATLEATIFDEFIQLGDIKSHIKGKKYGSIVLDEFIQLCKDQKYKKITGWLSPTDSDHFDQLRKFYGNKGFTVKIKGTEGNIEKIL